MKNRILYTITIFIAALLCTSTVIAQFNIDGQMIVRSEFRHGYSRAIPEAVDPAGFIAHRARLQAGYKHADFNFYMSIQDIRTWGSTAQANITDNFLSVHEAWGEFSFAKHWKVKLGRQELNYDNARFLGNLDWALQGRAHDFALINYEKDDSKLDIGFGFNQDRQALSNNIFTTPNQYRTAQLLHYSDHVGRTDFAFLFWNEGRQTVERDSLGNITREEVNFRPTVGLPTLRRNIGSTLLSGYFYYQFGRDVTGKGVSAFNASAQVTQTLFENKNGRKWRATLGYEVISGTDGDETETNKSFSLQYGTNHLFNGYMDWFFVANRWGNFVGLHDIYLRSRYTFGPDFWMQADGHLFSSYAQPLNTAGELVSDQSLGTELDLIFGWIINDAVSLQGGYSQFFTSESFAQLTSTELDDSQNWAYVMFVFRPTSEAKFIGVLK